MNKIIKLLIISGMVLFAFAEGVSAVKTNNPNVHQIEIPPPSLLELTGNFQIQMQKALWDNSSDNNLDDFFGRVNFGSTYKSEVFQTLVNIRAFPVGFGYEALTGAVFDTITDKLSLTKTKVANFQVEQAWFKYVWPLFEIRLGRFYTVTSKYMTLGNYLDQNPSCGFQSRITYHNAAEFTFKTRILSSSVLLGAGDASLNTGYLRIYETLTPMKNLTFATGYNGNVFDIAYNANAIVTNRFEFVANYEIIKGFCSYMELGIVQRSIKTDYDIPFLFGCSIPTGEIFSNLALEIEYLANRKVGKKDKPVNLSLYLDKKIGTRTRFQAGIYSDPQGKETLDLKFGMRMTAGLK
jgi:hypothetical protein